MTVFRAPALDKATPIVDPDTGRITPYFQRFWQNLSFTADTGANQSADIAALQGDVTTINGQITTINASKAPLASPTFTGDPKAPTAAGGDNDTSIATTAFVQGELTSQVVKLTGAQSVAGLKTFTAGIRVTSASGPTWTSGTGSPETVVTAPVGSFYSRTDGGAGTTLYVKESGAGNTGWVAK